MVPLVSTSSTSSTSILLSHMWETGGRGPLVLDSRKKRALNPWAEKFVRRPTLLLGKFSGATDSTGHDVSCYDVPAETSKS